MNDLYANSGFWIGFWIGLGAWLVQALVSAVLYYQRNQARRQSAHDCEVWSGLVAERQAEIEKLRSGVSRAISGVEWAGRWGAGGTGFQSPGRERFSVGATSGLGGSFPRDSIRPGPVVVAEVGTGGSGEAHAKPAVKAKPKAKPTSKAKPKPKAAAKPAPKPKSRSKRVTRSTRRG